MTTNCRFAKYICHSKGNLVNVCCHQKSAGVNWQNTGTEVKAHQLTSADSKVEEIPLLC